MSFSGKLWVTVDYMNGNTRVIGPLSADEISLHGLLFKLSEKDVAGVTFTRADPLQRLKQKGLENGNT